MKKINFAVVGYGHIGKRHAEMIIRNNYSNLIAVCDILSPQQLNLDSIPCPFYKDIKTMLNNHPEIDVVNIATPNGFHFSNTIEVLDYKKHVVIEKPLALSKDEAEKIIDKSIKLNKDVFAVMQNRFSPPSVWIKELVSSKILGEIYMIQLNCYWNRDERYYKPNSWHGDKKLDGGTLFTQFSHFIDILYWLFGDINNINGNFFDFNHKKLTDFEDSGIITFDLNSGGKGVISFSTSIWNKNLESSLTIIAENGSVKIGGQYMDKVEYCHVKNYSMPKLAPTNPGNDYGHYKGSAQNHHYVIENVIDVLNNNKQISTTVYEGMKVVDIIERIYNSVD